VHLPLHAQSACLLFSPPLSVRWDRGTFALPISTLVESRVLLMKCGQSRGQTCRTSLYCIHASIHACIIVGAGQQLDEQ